ncbi:MAG: MIP/aquaporin family protein [Actinomycetota bacterium]
MTDDLARRLLAEAIGTALLVAAVVGSGIMADDLSDDVGLVLLQNAVATFGALVALIHAFGPVSGAHFNPVVSLVDHLLGGLDRRSLLAYVPTQIVGAVSGGILANLMFELDAVDWSSKTRDGGGIWLGEVVATFGLIVLIFSMVRNAKGDWIPVAVGSYIMGAYYFTSSTSFANPAVTLGRTVSDTFAGIDPADAPAFVAFQVAGALVAWLVVRTLYPVDRSA